MYSFFPLLFPIFSQYSFRISGNRGYDNNRVRYFVSHVFPVSDLYTMTTTIYLKQTVYWTFRVLVNTWEEVLTPGSSSWAMCCVLSQSGSWSPFFSVSVCRSLVSFTPACSTTDLMLSSSFRITGICAETSRTRAPGKQWVYTLPLANVARTCRTMESPTITASRSVSRRGAKRLQVEISKTGGGGGDWISSGPPLLLLHPGSVVSWCRSEGHLGRSRPGCTGPVQRNKRSRGGGIVSSVQHTYPRLVSINPGCFQCCALLPQAGPAFQPARQSASPRPPAPAATNAARTCPHLPSKVDTNPPLKQVTVKQW